MAKLDAPLIFGTVFVLGIVGYILYVVIQKVRGEGFDNKQAEGFEIHQADQVGIILLTIFLVGALIHFGRIIFKK